MEPLLSTRDALWTWVVPAVLALVGLTLSIALRAPQLLRLREGFRAALAHDPRVAGTLPPGAALLLATAATWGTAAAVSAGTAVALGGPGALAWLWLFGLLLAPIRYAEVLLARTSIPGAPAEDAPGGSLASRLASDPAPAPRILGRVLLGLVPLAAFAYVGGAHGGAATEAAGQLLPGSEQAVGVVVAIAAALAVLPALGRPENAAPALGWLSVAALGSIFAVAFTAMLHEPALAAGAIPRALDDVFSGAQSVGAFSGAMAGEIAAAALIHVLPPLAATTGVDGAIHAAARAPTTRGQAAAALFGPLLHVVLATALGCAFVATGAFHRRVEGSRSLDEITFWRSGFETVSQRRETDRTFSGTLRVLDGTVLARPLELATERGTIVEPRYVAADGSPGDFALRIEDGRIAAMLVPDDAGTLQQVSLSETARVRVEGRMLPRGAAMIGAAMVRGGGEVASRIALIALLVLAALGAAGWGVAAARSVPRNLATPAAFLPALGLLLAATGVAPWLGPTGAVVAGALAVVAALGIALKLRELVKLRG